MSQVLQEQQLLKQELLEAAKKIGQLAEQEAPEAEVNGSVSKMFIENFKKEKFHKLLLPKKYGGPQIDLKTYTEICREVGYYNVSAAWLTYLYTIHNVFISFLPSALRDKIARSESLMADTLAPIGKAMVVEGGFNLSGEWHFTSGVLHSDWVGLGVFVQFPDQQRPEMVGAMIETSKVTVFDNWDTFGLRGTGSNTVKVENVFVPWGHTLRMENAYLNRRPLEDEYDIEYAFYGLPFNSTFSIGFSLAALGGAKRIIDEFKQLTEKRHRLLLGTTGNQTPQAQRVLAEMKMDLFAAEAMLEKYVELCEAYKLDQTVTNGAELGAVRVKIVNLCYGIATRAFANIGGTILANNNPLQRTIKDVMSVATHKYSLYEDGVQTYGLDLFGIETKTFA